MEQRAFIGMEFEAESYMLAVNRFKDQFGEPEPTYVSPCTSSRSIPQPEEQQRIRSRESIFANSPATSTNFESIVAKAASIIQPFYPRPRGRSPNNSWWDTSRGLWVTDPLPTALPAETQPDDDDYEVDRMSDDDEPPTVTPTKKRRMCVLHRDAPSRIITLVSARVRAFTNARARAIQERRTRSRYSSETTVYIATCCDSSSVSYYWLELR